MGVFEDSLNNLKATVEANVDAEIARVPANVVNLVSDLGKPNPPPAKANTGTDPNGPMGFLTKNVWWIVGGVLVVVLLAYGMKRRRF